MELHIRLTMNGLLFFKIFNCGCLIVDVYHLSIISHKICQSSLTFATVLLPGSSSCVVQQLEPIPNLSTLSIWDNMYYWFHTQAQNETLDWRGGPTKATQKVLRWLAFCLYNYFT